MKDYLRLFLGALLFLVVHLLIATAVVYYLSPLNPSFKNHRINEDTVKSNVALPMNITGSY